MLSRISKLLVALFIATAFSITGCQSGGLWGIRTADTQAPVPTSATPNAIPAAYTTQNDYQPNSGYRGNPSRFRQAAANTGGCSFG